MLYNGAFFTELLNWKGSQDKKKIKRDFLPLITAVCQAGQLDWKSYQDTSERFPSLITKAGQKSHTSELGQHHCPQKFSREAPQWVCMLRNESCNSLRGWSIWGCVSRLVQLLNATDLAKAFVNFENSGLGLAEISHRYARKWPWRDPDCTFV